MVGGRGGCGVLSWLWGRGGGGWGGWWVCGGVCVGG